MASASLELSGAGAQDCTRGARGVGKDGECTILRKQRDDGISQKNIYIYTHTHVFIVFYYCIMFQHASSPSGCSLSLNVNMCKS